MNIIHFLIGKAKPESKNGIVKVVYNLARQQALLGHHVEVWSVTDVLGEAVLPGFLNRYFPRTKVRFILHRSLEAFLKKLFPKETIFHLHGNYVPEHVSVTYRLKSALIPYVVTCHGILSPQAHTRGYVRKYFYKHIFELGILRDAAGVHVLGEKEAEDISAYGVEQSKIFEIPNGIDLDAIPIDETSESLESLVAGSKDKKKLLYIGRLDPFHKGLDLLLKGFAEACRDREDIILIIAGPDHKGGLEVVRGIIQDLKIKEKVFLLPPVYGIEKYKLLRKADLYVQPSRWEGMPVGVLEALACGKPCLVTHETNIGEKILQYHAGFTVKLDQGEISKAILEAFSVRADLNMMGRNARQMIEQEFVWTKIAEEFCEVYKNYVIPG